MRSNLEDILITIDLAKVTYNRIMINFFWAFAYNLLGNVFGFNIHANLSSCSYCSGCTVPGDLSSYPTVGSRSSHGHLIYFCFGQQFTPKSVQTTKASKTLDKCIYGRGYVTATKETRI